MYNPKPRLRELTSEKEEILTNGLVYQTYGEAINRAIQLARGKTDRVLSLLKSMDAFRREDMERVCGEAEVLADISPDEDRLVLWTEVRNLVAMHAGYRTARWAFPSDNCRSLAGTSATIRTLRPCFERSVAIRSALSSAR
jgi:hypothetical protein